MPSLRMPGFIQDTTTIITQELQAADTWSGLKTEYDAMVANGIQITDADVAELGVTAQQFLQALAAMMEVVNFLHDPVRAAKLYRVRR